MSVRIKKLVNSTTTKTHIITFPFFISVEFI